MHHLRPLINLWLKELENFKEFLEKFISFAQAGVNEEMKKRSSDIGNDHASLEEYRDKILIELLKHSNKL